MSPKKYQNPALHLAVSIAGGQSSLARAVNKNIKNGHNPISQRNVWAWLYRNQTCAPPAEYCAAIEAATNGEVTRQQLRPDIF